MLDVFAHDGKAIRCGRPLEHALLETLVGREVHVLWVGCLGAVNNEIIFEHVGQLLGECCRPYSFSVFLHLARCGEGLASKQYLFGIGCLEAEHHLLTAEVRRDNRFREQSCHHSRCKLLFFTGGSGRGLAVLHRLFCGLGTEQQAQGVVEEILGVHPCVAVLVGSELLDRANALLV